MIFSREKEILLFKFLLLLEIELFLIPLIKNFEFLYLKISKRKNIILSNNIEYGKKIYFMKIKLNALFLEINLKKILYNKDIMRKFILFLNTKKIEYQDFIAYKKQKSKENNNIVEHFLY